MIIVARHDPLPEPHVRRLTWTMVDRERRGLQEGEEVISARTGTKRWPGGWKKETVRTHDEGGLSVGQHVMKPGAPGRRR
jgi:hypothetical protein